MARRDRGSDSIYFDHEGSECTDEVRHRHCKGRWRGEIQLGRDGSGRRIVRKVSATTKTAVADKLRQARADVAAGIKASSVSYTISQAAADYLETLEGNRAPGTVLKERNNLKPLLALIGAIRLRELGVQDVDRALRAIAATRSTGVVGMTHQALTRTIRYAETRDLVLRNVSGLATTPAGQPGRPSRSFTADQVRQLLKATTGTRMHAYVAVSVGTAARTEEMRALTWDHVDLDGDPEGEPPMPPAIRVWRSVRAHGDTKTRKSRRTLALPAFAVDALRAHELRTGTEGLVFKTRSGRAIEARNLREEFDNAVRAAGIEGKWAPRELRTTGVSLMSLAGLPIEEIARIAGHSSSQTTETVYRRELRPVITTGTEVMDKLLGG